MQRDASSGRSGPSVTLIGLAVVIVLFVVFFLQNSEHLTIDFLVFEKRTTIRWSLLVAVVLGILFDRIITMCGVVGAGATTSEDASLPPTASRLPSTTSLGERRMGRNC